MDIDFLSSLGGCSRFIVYPVCMATVSNSSSSSSVFEISSKPHHFLLFFGLLFILLALVTSSGDPLKPSPDMASNLPSHGTLFTTEKAGAKTVGFKKGNSNPRANYKFKGKKDQFEASDHEVPSGPNPISNR